MLDGYTGQSAGAGHAMLLYTARSTTDDPASQCVPQGSGLYDDSPYLISQVQSQRGGVFRFELPPGAYCYRTLSEGRELSDYVRFEVTAGQNVLLEPVLNASARVEALILDEAGAPNPGRVTVVGTHPMPEGSPDSPHRFLFELRPGERWRTTDFVPDDPDDPSTRRYIEQVAYADASGQASFMLRPSKPGESYTIYLSRGPEFDPHVIQDVVAKPGETIRVSGTVRRTMKTPGYLSGDFHIHARGSIDSGLDYNRRVISLAGEGLEVAVSSDHNYVSDYAPYILGNDLEPFMSSVIGLELTTFEAGHFNAFPMRYDVELANRGSFQWQQQPPGLIFEELRQRGSLGPDDTIVQVNHPRDTILGYFSQHNVDALDATVELPFREEDAGILSAAIAVNGPAFYEELPDGTFKPTFSWNFDAIEIMNGKRTELLRHFRADKATLRPLYADFYLPQELAKDDAYDQQACEQDRAILAESSCIQDPNQARCTDAAERLLPCERAEAIARTAAEAKADRHLALIDEEAGVVLCTDNDVAFPGHLDDWYNLLNSTRAFGLRDYEELAIEDEARKARYRERYKKYTATGNSDSHTAEFTDPGYPRNYFYVGHDDPTRFTSRELVTALQGHRNIVSNGPFVTLEVEGEPIGSQIEVAAGSSVTVTVSVSTSSWIVPDRWRLIANGELAREGEITLQDGAFTTTFELNLERDTWLVAEIEGSESMFPLLAPSEIPPFDFQSAIGTLAEPFGLLPPAEGLQPALTFPSTPFAFTNPIWVVTDGDGVFTPLDLPQLRCAEGVVALEDGALEGIRAPQRPLGSRRLDALNVPIPLGHPKPLNRRLKGEVRDVRVIFDAWGHSH